MSFNSFWVEQSPSLDLIRVSLGTGMIEETVTREALFGSGVNTGTQEAVSFNAAMTAGAAIYGAEVSGVDTYGVVELTDSGAVATSFGFSGAGSMPVTPLIQTAWLSNDGSLGVAAEKGTTYKLTAFDRPGLTVAATHSTGASYLSLFVTPSGAYVVYKAWGPEMPLTCVSTATGSVVWTLPDTYEEDRRIRDDKYLVVGTPGNERLVLRSEASRFDLQVIQIETGVSSILTDGFFPWREWSAGAMWVCHNPNTGDAVGVTSGGLVLVKNDYSVVTKPGGLTAVGSLQFDEGSDSYYLGTSGGVIYKIPSDFSGNTLIAAAPTIATKFLGFSAPANVVPSFWTAFNQTQEIVE